MIDLPPLGSLPAFEAASRFGSFSKAAQQLNSSQPAISQQIRQLEQAVGQPLFRRKSQGVVLTPAGEDLLQAVQSGFAALRAVMVKLRQPSQRQDLTVATDFAFAAYWLLPRLDRFKAEKPLVDVRILTAQHIDDLSGAYADIAILFGDRMSTRPAGKDRSGRRRPDRARSETTVLLFAERVFPVCAPSYAQAMTRGGDMAQGRSDWLGKATLLHLDDVATASAQLQRRGDRWLRWPEWLQAAGVTVPIQGPQLRFNNYTLVLQAAIAGQGVALGWTPLVEPLIKAGQLRRAHRHVSHSDRGYVASLLRPEAATLASSAFLDWLIREATDKA
ncbi:MAG TPA: LysR family transcriptional regulator [Dongiaceae bacterium]